MDWQAIIKQQQDLENSFTALRLIFEQAEKDFKNKSQIFLAAMSQIQTQDATNLAQIHQALQKIIDSNNSVKQNADRK
jgi:cytochrome c556